MLTKLAAALVVALLCATAVKCELEKPQLSRQLTITMPKSTSVSMGDQLYTISMTDSSVHVNSSDASRKACDMTIDPAKDSIKGEMRVATSDDMMYIWGEHSEERVDGKDRTKYSLLMIDPRECSLRSADVGSDVNVGMKPSLPRLLVNRMGVDLYFPDMRTCAPCRFNNQGAKVRAPPQIAAPEARDDGRIFSFDLRKIGPNYLYAQNGEGKEATLRSLDGNGMNVLKERQVDYPVDTMANTKDGLMGVCSRNHDRRMMDILAYKEINCERINANLDSNAKITIPIEPYSRPVSRVSYDIANEKMYIGFAVNQELRVHVYDMSGQLLKSYDLGKIDERFEKYERRPMFYMPYSHWNVRGFVHGNDEYCLVTEQVSDKDKHEVDLHDVRCINV